MPKQAHIRKVLILGSGPIVIGQAAEFDYAGAQACLSLREEGVETVLLNSNPATIMTDADIADKVYIEPMTLEVIEMILERERPDGILPTIGGQTGLNLGMKIAQAGLLEKFNVKLLGTSLETIYRAEDREAFRNLMLEIDEPIPKSRIANSVKEAQKALKLIGLPLIIRPAYTLGGSGGGIAFNAKEFKEICERGLEASPIHQVLIEQYIGGMKEIEYEVMRDSADNCITICNMENFDPVGIHTGDSIVVAPSQTLSDREYQMLRTASIKIIRALGVEGGCNIQFALDPKSFQYYIIEVNPRVSRSSALASKATGYPIARIAAKIAIGLTLDEIPNAITQKTVAAFEPALDYVVLKIPRFPFDKFPEGNRMLGSQMKATGEVMSIDRTFEGALQKAIRSLDSLPELDRFLGQKDFWEKPTDLRLLLIFEAIRSGKSIKTIHKRTKIDMWFLQKIANIVKLEQQLNACRINSKAFTEKLKQAKRWGCTDARIAELTETTVEKIKKIRTLNRIEPTYKMVDTCAGEFEAHTPYFYSCWEVENEAVCPKLKRGEPKPEKAIVLGSGPIRIGQGIEFDYCSVHAAMALRSMGKQAIMVNNNPETVSTDFDVSDRLYFEPLDIEDVMHIYENEASACKPEFIVQFGGQTSLSLASQLAKQGIMAHAGLVDRIELASNRDRFEKLLSKLDIPYPQGKAVNTPEDAITVANQIGYPVLIRPSFVLGGRAMEIVYSEKQLKAYIAYVFKVSPDAPVLVDKYITGKEAEVDLLYDGEDVLIPGIMEHIERAGIHSGDSMAVYPTQGLTLEQIDTIVDYSTRLASAIGNRGLTNIQYVLDGKQVYVIEANPRGSRTVPFLSKITGIPMVTLATHIIYGEKLRDLGYLPGLYPESGIVAVKAPVFSFAKLTDVNTRLGPEMKSTGEVMGIDTNYPRALHKAFLAAGITVPLKGKILATIADEDKQEALTILRGFDSLGYPIIATKGTSKFLNANGIKARTVKKIASDKSNDILDLIKGKKAVLVINTPTQTPEAGQDGPLIRQTALEYNVPCLTSLDTARALLFSLRGQHQGRGLKVKTMQEYLEL
ncbi:MAG TPA: carbamoyl-phosphate synthase large subunit [bacterium]|nr:carbamoyl-phosphate synthase large subunit [bacterium]